MSSNALRKQKALKLIGTVFLTAVFSFALWTIRAHETSAAPGITKQINYQAKLLTSANVPVASGTFEMKFSIYDAESGGNVLWTASGDTASPDPIDVSVTSLGLLSVLLGSGSQNSLDTVDWNTDALYLGVTVGSDSEMSPRKRIGAVAQAFNSEEWNGYRTATSIESGESVLKLEQLTSDAATVDRTTLLLTTSGTSNEFDLFLKLNNGSSDVFTISRQGHATTTGNFGVSGTTILGDTSSDSVVINSVVSSDIIPDGSGTRSLGSLTSRWQGFFSAASSTGIYWVNATGTNTTSTNLFATNLDASNLRWNGATGTNLSVTQGFTASTATIATLNFSNATGSSIDASTRISLGGVNVCLADGTNCQASGSSGENFWTYDSDTELTTTVTSTQSVLIGGDLYASSTLYVNNPKMLTQLVNIDPGTTWSTYKRGNYLYVTAATQFLVYDVTVPSEPYSVGTSTGYSALHQLDLAGDYAYVADYSGSIYVIDISDPSLPTQVDSVALGDNPWELKVKGNYLYVSNEDNGLRVINISDPTDISIVASVDPGGSAYGVDVQGDFAYVAANNTFYIVDISDPLNPNTTQSLTTGNSNNSVYVNGRYAYVTDFGGEFYVYDVASSTNITILDSLSGLGQQNGVWVAGDYAYIAGNSLLRVIDISDRDDIFILSSLSLSGVQYIYVSGRHAYVSGGNSGFYVVDLQGAKISTAYIGNLNVDEANVSKNLDVANRLFVGTDIQAGKEIVADGTIHALGTNTSTFAGSISSLFILTTGSVTSTFSYAVSSSRGEFSNALAVGGVNVCLSDGTNCQTEFPNTITNTPTSTSNFSTAATVSIQQTPYSIQIQGDYAFLGGSWLQILDITDPEYPRFVSRTFVASCSECRSDQLHVSGKYAYWAADGASNDTMFQIFDVSDPGTPSVVGTLDMSASAGLIGVHSDGPYAYAVHDTDNTLYIIDAHDKANPFVASSIAVSSTPLAVEVRDGTAYVISSGEDVLNIVDVSDPTAPIMRASVNTSLDGSNNPNPVALKIQGAYAFVANQTSSTVSAINISTSTSPQVVGEITVSHGSPEGIDVTGRYVYVTNESSSYGVDILDFNDPYNPVNAGTLATGVVPHDVAVRGRYAFSVDGSAALRVSDISAGIETLGIRAGNADVGWLNARNASVDDYLSVRGSVDIGGGLYVSRGLAVGGSVTSTFGGNIVVGSGFSIFTGSLSVTGSGTTTFAGPVSSTRGEFSQALTVGGVNVCLYDETNCSPDALLFTWNTASSTIETVTSTSDIKFGGQIDNTLIANDDFVAKSTTTLQEDPQEVKVQGDYMYVLNTNNQLEIFSVAPDGSTSSTARLSTNGSTANRDDFEIQGNYLYLGLASAGDDFLVIDISNPNRPVTVATTTVGSGDHGLAVRGRYAYMYSGGDLDIIDIASSTNPIAVSSLDLTIASGGDVALRGDYAYVLTYGDGDLYIIDISNPFTPVNVRTITGFGGVTDFTIQDDKLYAVDSTNDLLRVVDISSSTNAILQSSVFVVFQSDSMRLNVSGRYAYVTDAQVCNASAGSDERGGLFVVDVASSTAPTRVMAQEVIPSDGLYRTLDVYTQGRFAYVALTGSGASCAGGNDSVHIFDINGIETNGLIAHSADLGTLTVRNDAHFRQGITVEGLMHSYGDFYSSGNFVLGGDLSVAGDVNVSGTLRVTGDTFLRNLYPQTHNTYDIGSGALSWRDIYASGTLHLAGDIKSNYELVIQTTDDLTLNANGMLDLYSDDDISLYASGVTQIVGNLRQKPLETWSVKQISEDQQAAGILAHPFTIRIDRDIAFISGNTEEMVGIYKMGRDERPHLINSIDIGDRVLALDVSGNYLFVASYDDDLFSIYNIADPAHPEFVTSTSAITTIGAIDLHAVNSKVYISTNNSPGSPGLTIVDISDITDPTQVGRFNDTGGSYARFNVRGNYVYVADGNGDALEIIDVSSSTSPFRVGSVSCTDCYTVDVSGHYAYTVNNDSTGLINVYDIATSTAPSLVESAGLGIATGNGANLIVRNNIVYLTSGASNGTMGALEWNASTTEFTTLATLTNTAILTNSTAIAMRGNDLIVTGDNAGGTATYIVILETGGTEVASIEAGTLLAGHADIEQDLFVHRNAKISGGLNVGSGGLTSDGIIVAGNDLKVLGNIENILGASSTLERINTTTLSDKDPEDVWVDGEYVYILQRSQSQLEAYQITNETLGIMEASAVPVGGTARRLFIADSYAYVVNQTSSSLQIIDIHAPGKMFTATSTRLPAAPRSVWVQGKYAYVVGADSLMVMDVSNPLAPYLVTSTDIGTTLAMDVAVRGQFAYVADYSGQALKTIDIGVPNQPVVTSTASVAGSSFDGVAIQGPYLYAIAQTANTLRIYSVANPASLGLFSTLALPGIPEDIQVSGRYAYIAIRGSVDEVVVVDVINPVTPRIVSRTLSNDETNALALSGRHLFAVTNGTTDSIIRYDISGAEVNGLIAHSAKIGNLQVSGNGYIQNSLSVHGGINVGIGGIQSAGPISSQGGISISPKLALVGIASGTAGIAQPSSIWVNGDHLYVVDDRVEVFDVNDPRSPKSVGSSSGETAFGDSVIDGRYLYVVGNSALDIYDLSRPASTTRISTTSFPTSRAITKQGRYLYVITGNSGEDLVIMDVEDPLNPVSATTVTPGYGGGSSIDVQGGYAYVSIAASSDQLAIIDVSDPRPQNNPIVAIINTSAFSSAAISVQGNYAYVADEAAPSGGIAIYDISDPTAPFQTATATDVVASAMIVRGDYMYVQHNTTIDTLRVYDITSSTHPVLVDETTMPIGAASPSNEHDMVAVGGYLYVLSSNNNVYIYDTGHLDVPGLEAAHASFGGFTLLGNGYVSDEFVIAGGLSVARSSQFSDEVMITGRATSTAGTLQVTQDCTGNEGEVVALFSSFSGNLASIRCNGQIFAQSGTIGDEADYAEYFISSDGTLAPGESVVIDTASATTVRRGLSSERAQTLGVVSERGVVEGNGAYRGHPSSTLVGLLGILPTQVTAVTSSIAIGDTLMVTNNGFATKAQGPGMVLGTALESLSSGTGTITVFVRPHWWAGDMFVSSDNGSLLVGDLTITSTTQATASSTTVDSPLFSFRGTSYSTTSQIQTTSTFSLWNDMIDASSSQLTISHDSTSTSLFTMNTVGDIAISGKFYPSKNGTIQHEKYIFYDDGGVPGDYIRTNAAGWGTGSYDFAEFFPSDDDLSPGDIVVVDPLNPEHVKKSSTPGEGAIVGIVSTRPGFLAGNYEEGQHAIALQGRVPTKVTTENGIILSGDYLTPSSESGVAMRATEPGPVVGIAMQDFDGTSASSTITAYVYVGWSGGTSEGSGSGSGSSSASPRAGLAEIDVGGQSVDVTFESVASYPIVHVTPYDLPSGEWGIRNITDTGFTIILMQEQSIVMRFAWTAEPSPSDGMISKSDGTSAPYNEMTGEEEAPPDP